MPIFTSQLGKIENQTPDEAVKTLANYVRKMQDELEYRLSVLDSSNISEIDANETSVFVNGKPISNVLEDERGYVSKLEQDVLGISATVEAQGKSIASLSLSAGELAASVESVQTGLSHTLSLSAGGLIISNQDDEAVMISGGQIDAETLKVKAANVVGVLSAATITADRVAAGRLNADNIALDGLMTIDSNGVAGMLGGGEVTTYGSDGKTTTTTGVILLNNTDERLNMIYASNMGAKLKSGTYQIYAQGYGGNVGCFSSVSMSQGSDRRLKNTIKYELNSEETLFSFLKPCTYRMNMEGAEGKVHWGFIAQDVISAAENAEMDAEKLAVIGESDGMYALAYCEITALNTHMIQKLMARIEALEAKT